MTVQDVITTLNQIRVLVSKDSALLQSAVQIVSAGGTVDVAQLQLILHADFLQIQNLATTLP